MSLHSSLGSSIASAHSGFWFDESVGGTGSSSWLGSVDDLVKKPRRPPPLLVPSVQREGTTAALPVELMHRIFMEVLDQDGHVHAMVQLSLVSTYWYKLVQHPVMWEYVAKKIFVVYPLLMRLHRAPLSARDRQLLHRVPYLGSAERRITQHDPLEPLVAPSCKTLHHAIRKVAKYHEKRRYYELVQRRRTFVLHLFLSLALLTFSLFLMSTICTSEGLRFGEVCTTGSAFSFLWLTYLSLLAILIANIVMETHFEPQPLVNRLRKGSSLIKKSSVAIIFGYLNVCLPTYLIQLNLARAVPISWVWCGATTITSLLLWQLVVLRSIVPEAKQRFLFFVEDTNPLEERRLVPFFVELVKFAVLNVPNCFPTLFAVAVFCLLKYAENGNWFFVFVGTVPIVVCLLTLATVFLLDFLVAHHKTDLIAGSCLLLATIFPLSLMLVEFRGACLIPLAMASFSFFLAHGHEILQRLVAARKDQDGMHFL